ncbi:MAG: acetylglutamate kinase [Alphaproteobacteria bacterium]|nr:acetylglutamate kinase [Alphaproteobacteria bacterium]
MRPISYKVAANLIVQALPYIQKFAGKTVVVKYGGNAMTSAATKAAVMQDVVLMRCVGIRPVLVHGGGPDINQALTKMGIESQFVGGLRVTDGETMEVVEMVLSGKTNKHIVAEIQKAGGQAVGLSGKDGGLITAEKETANGDIGFVGRIVKVDTSLIHALLEKGYIPVVSSVAAGVNGESFNVNADTVAGELATALKAEKLILMTDVTGIYRDFADKTSLISRMSVPEAEAMVGSGVIDKGMIPKVQSCITALRGGVGAVHVIDGTMLHALIVELFTDQGIGTMVEM